MEILSNRRLKFTLIAIFIVIILIVGLKTCTGFLAAKDRIEINPILIKASRDLNNYDISVEFNPEDKTLQCIQKVKYTNRTDSDLTHIYFHLYPNAFKDENKPVFDKEEMGRAYPNGFSPGFLEIEKINIDGKIEEFITGGYSDDLLMLLMDGSLMPGESTIIDMYYTVQLPNSMGRFGYGDNTFKAANWYPIASVYDESGWNLDRYYAIGDPFYSDMANYNVNITAPTGYVIASTGDVVAKNEADGYTSWSINAVAVRDFAWLASDKFKVSSATVNDTTVYSYYFSDNGGIKALDFAAAALEEFNRSFGKYPYNQLSVVESDFFIGGMEYPSLIMIDHSMYSTSYLEWLELVTVHETAHQWWYGLVGNNQVMDAWVDEGLAEYSTVLYYGLRYSAEREEEIYKDEIAQGKYLYLQDYARNMEMDESIHRPSYEFPNYILYDLLVYGKGAMMFHEIRKQIGDDVFFHVLQEYYKEFQFKNVGKKEIINTFNRVTGENWDNYFNKWLYNEVDE